MTNHFRDIFALFRYIIADDLQACVTQTKMTTKHVRRQKATAYVVEALVLSDRFRPHRDDALLVLELVDLLLAAITQEGEARTSLLRSRKHLEYILNHPEHLRGSRVCVACGDTYKHNESHACTNRVAKAKDRTMAHDDTILP